MRSSNGFVEEQVADRHPAARAPLLLLREALRDHLAAVQRALVGFKVPSGTRGDLRPDSGWCINMGVGIL